MDIRDKLIGRWENERFLYNLKSDGKLEIRATPENVVLKLLFTIQANGVVGEWWIDSQGLLVLHMSRASNELLIDQDLVLLDVIWGTASTLPAMILMHVTGWNTQKFSFEFNNDDEVSIKMVKPEEQEQVIWRRRR
ncbi:MAG: hypothetical protein AAF902_25115 [Chloroflexota bacterium]